MCPHPHSRCPQARRRPRTLLSGALAAVLAATTVTALADPAAAATPSGYHRFGHPTRVTNTFFPLRPGTEYVYDGMVDADGRAVRHRVVFTVTRMTKRIHGITAVVAWDRDYVDGELAEAELAFFAQDDAGNVWNLGEYPEEFDGGRFTGAPSTWIDGVGGAVGGIHMKGRRVAGSPAYSEGRVPAIGFDDRSRILRTGLRVCVPVYCYRDVLLVDEWSPNDPAGGHQRKYYAPGRGLIKVSAAGGDSREYLKLTRWRTLGPAGRAAAERAVLAMDRRAYRVSAVYRSTPPVRRG